MPILVKRGKDPMPCTKVGAGRAAVPNSGSLVMLITLFFGLSVHGILGQENSKPPSPTEAYKAALAPFTATKSQANDLTDADKYALGIGIAQASHDCLALSSDVSSLAGNANELFGLGQLCIFGQQFEPARAALVDYLALPRPPQREQALVLLVRAFLGLDSPVSAEAQVDSLLRDYTYDASIHSAIDEVIENTEGDRSLNFLALKHCCVIVCFAFLLSGRCSPLFFWHCLFVFCTQPTDQTNQQRRHASAED